MQLLWYTILQQGVINICPFALDNYVSIDISLGRTSYEKQTRIIEEVKRLEVLDQISSSGTGLSQEARLKQMDDLVEDFNSLFREELSIKPDQFAVFKEKEDRYLVSFILPITIF